MTTKQKQKSSSKLKQFQTAINRLELYISTYYCLFYQKIAQCQIVFLGILEENTSR